MSTRDYVTRENEPHDQSRLIEASVEYVANLLLKEESKCGINGLGFNIRMRGVQYGGVRDPADTITLTGPLWKIHLFRASSRLRACPS